MNAKAKGSRNEHRTMTLLEAKAASDVLRLGHCERNESLPFLPARRKTKCTICAKPMLRSVVDRLLFDQRSERDIAKQLPVSAASVHRHKNCPRLKLSVGDESECLEQIRRWLVLLLNEIRQLQVLHAIDRNPGEPRR